MWNTGPVPVVACDLDGVVWRGRSPVAGAAEAIGALRAAGWRVGFLTNNSSATVADVAARLRDQGIDAHADDVLTSALAAATVLAGPGGLPPGARVLACAGAGVRVALADAGFTVVDEGPAEGVVVGWHHTFDFDRLTRAADAIRGGARFVATNLDPTYPVERGLLPGNGALVAAVRTASGVAPVVAGKPEAPMAALVRDRLGTRGIVVGDRPSTDGAMAATLGWPFALVRSGVVGAEGEEAVPDPPPAFLADDLAALVPALVDAAPGDAQPQGPPRP